MFLIVGLGNPEKRYDKTRHNIGFDTIDALADKYNISMNEKKHKALCGTGVIDGVKVLLAKPQTYMNLSGDSVAGTENTFGGTIIPSHLLYATDRVGHTISDQ